MNLKAINREMLRFGILLFALLLVYGILRTTQLYELTGHETEGLNTLILLVGSIYAVTWLSRSSSSGDNLPR